MQGTAFAFFLAEHCALKHPSPHAHRPPPWPHAPTHQLSQAGTYFVTAGTYLKAFCRSFSPVECGKPLGNVELAPTENLHLDKQTRRHSRSAGLVQLPRNPAHLPEVLFHAAELRSSKCGEARIGAGGEPVSMVLFFPPFNGPRVSWVCYY